MTFLWGMYGYQGRIGRLAYLGYSFALIPISVVLFLVAAMLTDRRGLRSIAALDLKHHQADWMTLDWGSVEWSAFAPLLAALAAMFWSVGVITAKRFHDLGYPGWFAVGMWFLQPAGVVLSVIAGTDLTPFAGAISLIGTLLLVFWPGDADANRYGDRHGNVEGATPSREARMSESFAPEPATRTSTAYANERMMQLVGPRRGFGARRSY